MRKGICDVSYEGALVDGSWFSEPWSVRSAFRVGIESGYRDSAVGFRVARTLF